MVTAQPAETDHTYDRSITGVDEVPPTDNQEESHDDTHSPGRLQIDLSHEEPDVQEDPAQIAADVLREWGIQTVTVETSVDTQEPRVSPTLPEIFLQDQQDTMDTETMTTEDQAMETTSLSRAPSPETLQERAQKQELRQRLVPTDMTLAIITLDSDEETEVTPSGQIIKLEPAMTTTEVITRRLEVSDEQT